MNTNNSKPKLATKRVLRRDFSFIVRPRVVKTYCELCGVEDDLEVHHIFRFSDQVDQVFEDLELVQYRDWDKYSRKEKILIRRNMIGIQLGPESFYRTLCSECHQDVHSYDNVKGDDLDD